jgi:hypothetical protein
MHTLGPESNVGLLLFDEPSASLDPVAEHGNFNLSEPSPVMTRCSRHQTFSRDFMSVVGRRQWPSQRTASVI